MTKEVADVLLKMKQARLEQIQKLLYGFVRHSAVNQMMVLEIELLDAEIEVLGKIVAE